MPLSKPRTSKVPQLPFIYPSNITSFLLSSSHKKNFFVVKQIKDDEKKKKTMKEQHVRAKEERDKYRGQPSDRGSSSLPQKINSCSEREANRQSPLAATRPQTAGSAFHHKNRDVRMKFQKTRDSLRQSLAVNVYANGDICKAQGLPSQMPECLCSYER